MLRLKRVRLDSGPQFHAYLHRGSRAVHPEVFPPATRIDVHRDGRVVSASVVHTDETALVAPDEIGLSERAFAALGLADGTAVEIDHARPPRSQAAMRRKIGGAMLDEAAYQAVVDDIVANRYGEREIAAFLTAAAHGLSTDEVLALTRARLTVARRVQWPMRIVVDKHSIGGIPGNRVSPIVIPIVAAHGLTIPKTSSRAITSPAGTADVMECIARIDLTAEEMRAVVVDVKGCIVWNGRLTQSPLDDVMIAVERPLGLDSRKLLVSSILSKKIAAGSTHVYVDIPVGPSAKVRTTTDADEMRALFATVGTALGLRVEAHLSDGTRPVGRGIGPVLELRDVQAVLAAAPDAPADLRDKALAIAGRILEFDGGLRPGAGLDRARALLESGAARRAFEAIVLRQGRNPSPPALAPHRAEVRAARTGVIAGFDCYRIATIARLAGAPAEKGAGIDLARPYGARVEAGETLYTIYAGATWDLDEAAAAAASDPGVTIAAG